MKDHVAPDTDAVLTAVLARFAAVASLALAHPGGWLGHGDDDRLAAARAGAPAGPPSPHRPGPPRRSGLGRPPGRAPRRLVGRPHPGRGGADRGDAAGVRAGRRPAADPGRLRDGGRRARRCAPSPASTACDDPADWVPLLGRVLFDRELGRPSRAQLIAPPEEAPPPQSGSAAQGRRGAVAADAGALGGARASSTSGRGALDLAGFGQDPRRRAARRHPRRARRGRPRRRAHGELIGPRAATLRPRDPRRSPRRRPRLARRSPLTSCSPTSAGTSTDAPAGPRTRPVTCRAPCSSTSTPPSPPRTVPVRRTGGIRCRRPAAFAAAMAGLGIGDDDVVVGYDDAGGVIAARLVWMLRATGHPAALLDGGLRPTSSRPSWSRTCSASTGTSPHGPGRPSGSPSSRTPSTAATSCSTPATGPVPRRPRARRSASRSHPGSPQPAGPREPHVRGLRAARRRPAGAVRRVGVQGPDAGARLVSSCGSGVTACHTLLLLEHAGLGVGRLYAGSWSAYSSDPALPVATGDEPG
jgi:thiosulfate/3-mercaptopyruvate sulfurtransferase